MCFLFSLNLLKVVEVSCPIAAAGMRRKRRRVQSQLRGKRGGAKVNGGHDAIEIDSSSGDAPVQELEDIDPPETLASPITTEEGWLIHFNFQNFITM